MATAFSSTSAPTSNNRSSIRNSGGITINLDTNWSSSNRQTGPLVVIPDNATSAQRQQAQAYANAVSSAYSARFGTSLPGRVLTRSQNGRGRANTIHTEPYSVNDTKAVEYFTRTAEGRQALASITRNTLGQIPGAVFALPHGGVGGDPGAVGPLGSEVDNARILLGDMFGGSNGMAGSGNGGRETTSTSATPAAPTPHQNSTPIGTPGDLRYGSIANPQIQGGGSAPGVTANMSPAFQDQYNRVYNALEGTKFAGGTPPPTDGAKYGVTTGSRAEWANFFTRLASVESSFNPNERDGTKSHGLYQMGTAQFNQFGGGNIYNANDNTRAFVRYAENLMYGKTYGSQNVISARGPTPEGYYGLAAAYGPLRKTLDGAQNQNESQLLAGNIAASEGQGGSTLAGSAAPLTGPDATGLAVQGGQMVQNQDPHGATAVMDLNNMASGLFAYPSAGAMLWCFFREGNPLYPVYFAASYGQKEWQSAYRYASEGVGMKPTATPDNPVTSKGGTLNLDKAAALHWVYETDPRDSTKNQRSFMITGHDGSNMFFNEGYHQIYSKFDRRDITEGDSWRTVLGYEEKWVQGDSNTVVMGDMFVKVGNVGPDAVKAVERIQEIIKDSMKPLTEPRDCSSSGGSGTGTSSSAAKPKNEFTKKAEATAIPKVDDTLFKTNNITPVTVAGGPPSPAPAPTIAPTTAAAANPTSVAASPVAANFNAGGSAPNSQVNFVPNRSFSSPGRTAPSSGVTFVPSSFGSTARVTPL